MLAFRFNGKPSIHDLYSLGLLIPLSVGSVCHQLPVVLGIAKDPELFSILRFLTNHIVGDEMTAPLPVADDVATVLSGYHRQVEDVLTRKLQAVAGDDHTKANTIAQIRWELVRVLREYQIYKHARIFDPFIAMGTAAPARLATELKERCLAASDDYKTHVREWSLSGADNDWAAYESDLLRVIKAIRSHIAVEAQNIKALLVQR